MLSLKDFVLDLVLGGELFGLIYSDSKNKDSPEWKQSRLYRSFGMEDEKPIKGVSGLGVRKALFYSAGKPPLNLWVHRPTV